MKVARITPNNHLIMGEDYSGHIVLVPSIHLSFFKLQLPAKSVAQCQRIVAFTLEEELAEDIDSLHYSVQKIQDEWFVVVCSHQKMEQWLNLCREHHISPKKLIPDVLVLPEESNFLIEPEQSLLRLANHPPVAIDVNVMEYVVQQLADEHELSPFKAESYEELLESELQIDSHTINLLQGKYNKATSYGALLKPWLKVALWAGLLWTGSSIYLWLENQQLQQTLNANKQANIKKFRQLFPEETRIVNLRTQAEQKFRKIVQQKNINNINFIALTEDVITALQQHKNIKVSQLDYRKHALRILLDSNSVASIQNFINKLKKNPQLTVNVQSLGDNGGKAKATIDIKKIT